MINKVFLKENTIKIFTILCLSIILFQNYIYDKSHYHNQNYNAKNIEILSDDKERIKNLKIENIVLIADKNKNLKIANSGVDGMSIKGHINIHIK